MRSATMSIVFGGLVRRTRTQLNRYAPLGTMFNPLAHKVRQSEREHRVSKARFLRTSGWSIPKQLSRIERRQHQIRAIRQTVDGCHPQAGSEPVVASDPGVQYIMAESEKFSVHIPTFLQQNVGDPAVKVKNFPPSSSLAHTSTAELLPKAEAISSSSCCSATPDGGRVC